MIEQYNQNLVRELDSKPELYDEEFREYLRENWTMFCAFVRKCDQMRRTGRSYYSGWAIVNVIRWESDLREVDSKFKCNNNWTALLSRLYNAMCENEFLATRVMRGTNDRKVDGPPPDYPGDNPQEPLL